MTKASGTRWSPGVAARAAAVGALVLLAGAAPAPARAQAGDECESSSGKERLQCKFDRFAGEATKAATLLADSPVAGITEEQRASLRGAAARVDRERGRVKRTGGLETQAAKRRVKCLPRECDPEQFPPPDPAPGQPLPPPLCQPVDGDGVCEEGESCLEVVGDGIGNDVQPCAPGEVCAEICNGRATELDDNVDAASMAELETVYDDLAASARDVNDTLPALAAASVRVQALAGASADPCAEQAALGRWHEALRISSVLSASVTRGGVDVAERFCDQQSAGFALGSVCVAGEALSFALELFKATVDLAEGNVDALVMDASLACARQALVSAGDLSDRVTAARKKLEGIEQTQAYIIQLIETAQGQRPGFPVP